MYVKHASMVVYNNELQAMCWVFSGEGTEKELKVIYQ